MKRTWFWVIICFLFCSVCFGQHEVRFDNAYPYRDSVIKFHGKVTGLSKVDSAKYADTSKVSRTNPNRKAIQDSMNTSPDTMSQTWNFTRGVVSSNTSAGSSSTFFGVKGTQTKAGSPTNSRFVGGGFFSPSTGGTGNTFYSALFDSTFIVGKQSVVVFDTFQNRSGKIALVSDIGGVRGKAIQDSLNTREDTLLTTVHFNKPLDVGVDIGNRTLIAFRSLQFNDLSHFIFSDRDRDGTVGEELVIQSTGNLLLQAGGGNTYLGIQGEPHLTLNNDRTDVLGNLGSANVFVNDNIGVISLQGTRIINFVNNFNSAVFDSIGLNLNNSFLSGSANGYLAGFANFSGTSPDDTVLISGGLSTDIYVATPQKTSPLIASLDVLTVDPFNGGLAVHRTGGVTSTNNLRWNYVRVTIR